MSRWLHDVERGRVARDDAIGAAATESRTRAMAACLVAAVRPSLSAERGLVGPAAIRRSRLRRARSGLASGQGYRAIDHPDRPRHAHFPPGYPAGAGLDLAGSRGCRRVGPRRFEPVHAGGDPGGLVVVSPAFCHGPAAPGPGTGAGGQLAVGADRAAPSSRSRSTCCSAN